MKNGDIINGSTVHHVGTPDWPQTGKLLQIGPAGQIVRVGKTKNGEHFADVDGYFIPREIARLGAGRGEWMRGILFRCDECRHRGPVGEMECGLCQMCYDRAGEENARLDGHA
jgi:hypothetical protein